MPRLKCPDCGTIVHIEIGAKPVCPECGYGSPQRSVAASPGPGATSGSAPEGGSPGQSSVSQGDQRQTDGMSIAALVLGILSILGGFWLVVPAVLAIVFGTIGMRNCDEDPTLEGRGMAVTGLVLGIVGLAIMLLMFLFFTSIIAAF